MEREVVRGEFMDKFGDPLEGFDLEKPVVIWFPTHFVMVRIVFVAGALLLWSNPMALLLLRPQLITFQRVSPRIRTTLRFHLMSHFIGARSYPLKAISILCQIS